MHEALGTIKNGGLTLDTALPFKDHTRVRLTIEPVAAAESHSPERAAAAWERIQQRLRERPIHSGGVKYTRDELHERD